MKCIVIMPASVTGMSEGRSALTTAQQYVRTLVQEELGETSVDFIDSYWQNISTGSKNQNVGRLASMLQRVSEADFVFFTHGWANDPVCKLIKGFCEDSQDGIPHSVTQFFRK